MGDAEAFLFFGCWNNIDCNNEYNYRNIVLDFIAEKEKNVNTLYLAGDNWYNNVLPDKKIKTYLTSVLRSGYDRIYRLNKDTRVVVGNHDENVDKKQSDLKKNCMLNTQKLLIDQIDNISSYVTPTLEDLKPAPKGEYIRDNNSKIILYDDIGMEKIPGCYTIVFINTNKIYPEKPSDSESELDYLSRIESKIQTVNKDVPLFVIGHHPLISYKVKEKKNKYFDIKGDEKDHSISHMFFNILSENKCIYLCADTHSFQISEISPPSIHVQSSIRNIHDKVVQIVSGTGGGEPDEINVLRFNNMHDATRTVYMTRGNAVNSYGYTKIHVESNARIKVTYTKVIDSRLNKVQFIQPEHLNYVHKFEFYIKKIGDDSHKQWVIEQFDVQRQTSRLTTTQSTSLSTSSARTKSKVISNIIHNNKTTATCKDDLQEIYMVASEDRSKICFEKKLKEKIKAKKMTYASLQMPYHLAARRSVQKKGYIPRTSV